MYLGRLMEVGAAEVVFGGPHHPYTEALLSAVPTLDGEGGADPAGGRDPERGQPAFGLRLPHALPRKLGRSARRRSRRSSGSSAGT